MNGILYLQSEYSLLSSLMKLKDLAKKASDHNYHFLALTDDSLYGSYELFRLAKKYQFKPILGLKLEVEIPDKEIFLVYVKNSEGYYNLLKLNLLKENNETITFDHLLKYQKGLIFVSGGYHSIIDQTIMYGNEEEAINYINKYKNAFDDFYYGLSFNHPLQKEILLPAILNYQKSFNFKIVPIHQTNYFSLDDKDTYEILMQIKGVKESYQEFNLSFQTIDDLNKLNKFALEQFVSSINFNLEFPKYEMPKYETKTSEEVFLRSLANRGLKRRLELNNIKDDLSYQNRLNYELDIISSKGFTNYFLIVYDFILYAKSNQILVGPGRGSASGSLVSYVLGITEVDPIKYNLIFERFLNIERVSMPDIDIDFPDDKRNLVIDYVKNKYGFDNIAAITTFDTFQTRSAIRDVSRVLEIPQNRVTAIIAAVTNNKVDSSDELVSKVLKHAKKLEGLIRHTGTHPAGIVLSNRSFIETIPVKKGAYDFYQIAYDAKECESLGLNKIDFLGIRNLKLISDIVSSINEEGINFNLNNLSLDNKKTYDLLSSGNTNGIFQLESVGMRKVLMKLKPSNFEDVVATLALFRPGPMANIDVYIDRKNGSKFNFIDESLASILKPTYGIIIYQEQIMAIANKFAGYTLLEADNLRVGMGKKDLKVLESEQQKFIVGANKLGHSSLLAEEIFKLILKFADYGFNRSHSVAYSLVAYQMAYLKANFNDHFMKVMLNNAIGNSSLTIELLNELKNRNIKIHPPHINKSTNSYQIKKGHLLMPLTAIKSINELTYQKIALELENGEFTSFENLKSRLSNIISELQLTNLINSGALDVFKYSRKTLLSNTSLDSSFAKQFIKDFVIRNLEELEFSELSANELDALGINVLYDFYNHIKSKNINGYLVSEIPKNIKNTNVIGIIKNVTSHITKTNQKMLFITLTDLNNEIDITVFNEQLEESLKYPKGSEVIINCNISLYKNKTSYTLNSIKSLES